MKGYFYMESASVRAIRAADRQGDPAAARVRCGRRTEVRRRQTDRTGYCFAVHRAGQVNPAVRYADDARQAGAKCQPRRGGRCALCAARRGQDSGSFSRSATRRYIPHTGMYTSVLPPAAMQPSWCPACRPSAPRLCCHGPRPARTAKCCTSFRPRTAGRRKGLRSPAARC